jgi:UDP-N-acetylglucosamine 2-epimerase
MSDDGSRNPTEYKIIKVMATLDHSDAIEHIVHTGFKYDYELNQIFFEI